MRQEEIRVLPPTTHTHPPPLPPLARYTQATGSCPLSRPPGPHPDLVPELLSLLSQLLQLTHGAGPVGRGWGRGWKQAKHSIWDLSTSNSVSPALEAWSLNHWIYICTS